jgi:hypothetical protein
MTLTWVIQKGILFENLLWSHIKQDYLKKCYDAHVCMLILNFKKSRDVTARATPWPRRGMVWAPGPHSDAALPPIYSPRRENLKSPINFHETYYKPSPSSTRDWEGPEALPSTLPERRIIAGGLLHHHACLGSDSWVVYLGLRVHSSS